MPKTLLLADDSVVIQKLVGLSFANQDVELITADNGDDAIQLAITHRPDAVVADVIMPGKSGYEVCEAIVQDPALAHIPVLLLTGTFEAFDEERAKSVGAAGHITKPFEAQALVDRVTELFAGPPPAAAAAPAAPPAVEPLPAATPQAEIAWSSAFDFFEDDVTNLSSSSNGTDPLAAPLTQPFASAEPVSGNDLDAGLLGSDSTVALMPEDPTEAETELPASLIELEPDLHDGSATVLAEDLFDAPAPDESDWLAPPGSGTPDAAATVVAGLETFVEPIAEDTPPALDATVLADDLFDSSPAVEIAVSEARADPADAGATTVWTEPDAAQSAVDLQASSFDIAVSDLDPEPPASEIAPTPFASAQVSEDEHGLEAAAQTTAAALSTVARKQLHATLEKVAWEAFSELSEQVVRQVLERVEAIAWEVIPQMTETLVREEIRRMKGDNES
jgi:CheY-like chemotaxis protein